MAVDDLKVCQIIKEKLSLSTGTSRPERIGVAFDLITDERERLHPGDENYGVAEHYFFARWLISNLGFFGYTVLQTSNLAYSLAKALLPDVLIPRFGKGPTTPGSFAEIKWGNRGANDGLSDATFHGGRIKWFADASAPDPPDACK